MRAAIATKDLVPRFGTCWFHTTIQRWSPDIYNSELLKCIEDTETLLRKQKQQNVSDTKSQFKFLSSVFYHAFMRKRNAVLAEQVYLEVKARGKGWENKVAILSTIIAACGLNKASYGLGQWLDWLQEHGYLAVPKVQVGIIKAGIATSDWRRTQHIVKTVERSCPSYLPLHSQVELFHGYTKHLHFQQAVRTLQQLTTNYNILTDEETVSSILKSLAHVGMWNEIVQLLREMDFHTSFWDITNLSIHTPQHKLFTTLAFIGGRCHDKDTGPRSCGVEIPRDVEMFLKRAHMVHQMMLMGQRKVWWEVDRILDTLGKEGLSLRNKDVLVTSVLLKLYRDAGNWKKLDELWENLNPTVITEELYTIMILSWWKRAETQKIETAFSKLFYVQSHSNSRKEPIIPSSNALISVFIDMYATTQNVDQLVKMLNHIASYEGSHYHGCGAKHELCFRIVEFVKRNGVEVTDLPTKTQRFIRNITAQSDILDTETYPELLSILNVHTTPSHSEQQDKEALTNNRHYLHQNFHCWSHSVELAIQSHLWMDVDVLTMSNGWINTENTHRPGVSERLIFKTFPNTPKRVTNKPRKTTQTPKA